MLIALETEPVGTGYAALVRQSALGLALTLVARCDRPTLSPYYVMIAPAKNGTVSPVYELIVGYPDRKTFEETIRRAPVARETNPWLREDEQTAKRLLDALIAVAVGPDET